MDTSCDLCKELLFLGKPRAICCGVAQVSMSGCGDSKGCGFKVCIDCWNRDKIGANCPKCGGSLAFFDIKKAE